MRAMTEELANHVANYKKMTLTEDILQQVKRVLLDYFCCAITGSQTVVSKQVFQTLLELEGEGDYHVIGHKKKLSKTNAAFINGTSAHSLDLDDGHTKGSIHPGTVVLPPLLAEAEKGKPNFDLLARAIVIGYDVCLRISSALHPSSRKRGFHNTPVAGIFGAVAGLCVLNELNKKEVQNAFGIAASFAGGIFAFLGTGAEVKRIHPGQAARDALLAVELSLNGLTGPKSVLESENGLFQAFAGADISSERLLQNLGKTFEISNIYFKPYPCCRHIHSSVDAVYKLKEKNEIKVEDIVRIRVGVNSIAYKHRHHECQSLLDAQMSLPYTVALALLYPTLEIGHFAPENSTRQCRNLASKVEVYIDEHAETVYPNERAAKVEINVADGSTLMELIHNPLGEPSHPLDDAQLAAKFYGNCKSIIGEEKTEEMIANIFNIEKEIDFLYKSFHNNNIATDYKGWIK